MILRTITLGTPVDHAQIKTRIASDASKTVSRNSNLLATSATQDLESQRMENARHALQPVVKIAHCKMFVKFV